MFYYDISRFYQDFKCENLCFLKFVLSLRSENTGLVTTDLDLFDKTYVTIFLIFQFIKKPSTKNKNDSLR